LNIIMLMNGRVGWIDNKKAHPKKKPPAELPKCIISEIEKEEHRGWSEWRLWLTLAPSLSQVSQTF